MHDVIIIGGGPAGSAAAVYAARKQLDTLVITPDFGGQSDVSPDIQNWIGTKSVSGEAFSKMLQEHVEKYEGEQFHIAKEKVTDITKTKDGFQVETNKGSYESKSVLIASGSDRRKLNIPGADEFENKGVTYCASCDGPLFSGQDVVVVGGGNAGFETAAQLLAYTKSVTLLHKNEKFKADPVTVEKVCANPKMKAITNAKPIEIKGDKFVSAVVYEDLETGESHEILAGGVFAEIGAIPTTGFAKDVVELDEYNRIIVDPKNQRTSVDGIWAAGDATNGLFHQNNIAAGDAVKALEDLYLWLRAH